MDEPLLRTRTGLIRHRYVICLLVFTGLALVYAMRVNLSFAIISMTGSKGRNASSDDNDGSCPADSGNSVPPTPNELGWTDHEKALVLGSFFYGYISTQIPGGILADKFSIKWVFGYGIFLTSAFTCISHWVARWNVYAFIVLRILEGITEGVTFPAFFCLLSRWAPASERTTMTTFCGIGTNIGTVLTMTITAALCESTLGWPASFYLFGSAGIVWSIVWYLCATSQPENHPWISDEEKTYILSTRGTDHTTARKIPWMKILTSGPVWMFSMARFCASVTFYMFLTEMPTFIDSVFHISMQRNGYLNSLFYILYASCNLGSGMLSDFIMKRGYLSRTNVRKIFECAALVLSAFMLFLVTVVGCNWPIVAPILCIAASMISLVGGGDCALALDLAPGLTGSVMGLANTVGNLGAIVATTLVAYTADNKNVYGGWNEAFYVAIGINLLGALLFGIFGSAEEQPWSKERDDELSILPDENGDSEYDPPTL